MITPTDEQLNKAAAELCGWTQVDQSDPVRYGFWAHDSFECVFPDPPDFCNDRNALPELIQKVSWPQRFSFYMMQLLKVDGQYVHDNPLSFTIEVILADCRFYVIAALKACNAWPADWSTE